MSQECIRTGYVVISFDPWTIPWTLDQDTPEAFSVGSNILNMGKNRHGQQK